MLRFCKCQLAKAEGYQPRQYQAARYAQLRKPIYEIQRIWIKKFELGAARDQHEHGEGGTMSNAIFIPVIYIRTPAEQICSGLATRPN
jgi:hypothetical protein